MIIVSFTHIDIPIGTTLRVELDSELADLLDSSDDDRSDASQSRADDSCGYSDAGGYSDRSDLASGACSHDGDIVSD